MNFPSQDEKNFLENLMSHLLTRFFHLLHLAPPYFLFSYLQWTLSNRIYKFQADKTTKSNEINVKYRETEFCVVLFSSLPSLWEKNLKLYTQNETWLNVHMIFC